MLILSRRIGEEIVIGDGPAKVVVTVIRVDGSRVRLGLEAPPEVKILRGELVQAAESKPDEREAA